MKELELRMHLEGRRETVAACGRKNVQDTRNPQEVTCQSCTRTRKFMNAMIAWQKRRHKRLGY